MSLQSYDLSRSNEFALIWSSPPDTGSLGLPVLHMVVENTGKRTLKGAYLVLSIPTLASAIVADSFLTVNVGGPIMTDSMIRSVAMGPALSHVTYSIGQINPGQSISISEIITLDPTEHAMRLDTFGVAVEFRYSFTMGIVLTAENYGSLRYEVDLAMFHTDSPHDLETDFLEAHYGELERQRREMNFMDRWASYIWKEKLPTAMFIRPSWRQEKDHPLYHADEPWSVTLLGADTE